MGFRFRKSVNFGPFRVNLSKSGVGYSVGGKGFRVTKKAGGGTRTTASIPGTGISYVKDYGKGHKSSGQPQKNSVPAPPRDLPDVPTRPMSPTTFRIMHALALVACVALAVCAVVVAVTHAPGPAIILAAFALFFLRSYLKMPGRQKASIEYWEAFDAGVRIPDSTQGADHTPSGGTEPPRNRPIYQRPWFVALVIVLLLGALASACSDDDSTPTDDPVDQQEETLPAEDQTAETENAADPEALPGEASESQDEPESSQEPVTDPDTQSTPESAPAGQESQESTGSAPVVTPPVSDPDPEPTPAPQPQPEPESQETPQKTGYVGSIDSDKYHSPGCRWAKKILPENEVWFATKEEAQSAGYSPCGTCQ